MSTEEIDAPQEIFRIVVFRKDSKYRTQMESAPLSNADVTIILHQILEQMTDLLGSRFNLNTKVIDERFGKVGNGI